MRSGTKEFLKKLDVVPVTECSDEEYRNLSSEDKPTTPICSSNHMKYDFDNTTEMNLILKAKILQSLNVIKNILIGAVIVWGCTVLFYAFNILKIIKYFG